MIVEERAGVAAARQRVPACLLWVAAMAALTAAMHAVPGAGQRAYAAALLVGGAGVAVAGAKSVRRRRPDRWAWAAFGAGLAASTWTDATVILQGAADGQSATATVVLAVSTPLVLGALPRLTGLARASRAALLDAALVALAGLLWAWETGLRHAEDVHVTFTTVALLLACGTLALLTGSGGRIDTIRALLAVGFLAQAAGLAAAPGLLDGGQGAGPGARTLVLVGLTGYLAAAAAAARGATPRSTTSRTLRWWAPSAAAVGAIVAKPLLDGHGHDSVGNVLVGIAGAVLLARIVWAVRGHERLAHRLRHDNDRLDTLLSNLRDDVLVVDGDLVVVDRVGRARPGRSGTRPGAVRAVPGTPLRDVVAPDHHAEMRDLADRAAADPGAPATGRLRLRGTEPRWVEATVVDCAADPLVGGFVVTHHDITARIEAEADLVRQATVDPLTGLPNRTASARALADDLAGAGPDRPVEVLHADIERLRVVNDGLGRATGDAVVAAVAARWRHALPGGWRLGRAGAGEFLAWGPADPGLPSAAKALLDALDRPVIAGGGPLVVTAGIGIARVGAPTTDVDAVMLDAVAAATAAKRSGRNRTATFDAPMRAAATERVALEQALRRDLAARSVGVHFQPIVDLATGLPATFEALLRWDRPDQGPVPADRAIALAEETGLIVELGAHVLDRACAAAATALRVTGRPLRVAVNTSGLQLLDPGFPTTVMSALARHRLRPGDLVLEVTESALLEPDGPALAALSELHAAGVAISLDDFGTGYSSLSYLGTFPLDELKLDRSLVTGSATCDTRAAVLDGVLAITRSLGLPVVAEGLEDAAAVERMRRAGATHGQGWYHARAMPLADALAWVLRTTGDVPDGGDAARQVPPAVGR